MEQPGRAGGTAQWCNLPLYCSAALCKPTERSASPLSRWSAPPPLSPVPHLARDASTLAARLTRYCHRCCCYKGADYFRASNLAIPPLQLPFGSSRIVSNTARGLRQLLCEHWAVPSVSSVAQHSLDSLANPLCLSAPSSVRRAICYRWAPADLRRCLVPGDAAPTYGPVDSWTIHG